MHGWALKTGPSRRHRIQPAEGPVLDPRAKETCFKKGQKVGTCNLTKQNLRIQTALDQEFEIQSVVSLATVLTQHMANSLWSSPEKTNGHNCLHFIDRRTSVSRVLLKQLAASGASRRLYQG